MATITLAANTNVSALSLANDDTIDLAGFVLTFDVQPTVTGIQVTTPGTAGTCVFPVACVIPTWDFFAGAGVLIATLPANCEIGNATGGSTTSARGISTNNGVVGTSQGGAGGLSHGVFTNNGTVDVAVGSDSTGSHGVFTNNGIVNTANGGAAGSAVGVMINNRTVGTANGGTSGAGSNNGVGTNNGAVTVANGGIGNNANGINTNNGTCVTANGGQSSLSRGIRFNNGVCLRAFDDVERAIFESSGDYKVVIGPDFRTTIVNPAGNMTTIYSVGKLSDLATIPPEIEVVELSGGAAFSGIGRTRRLGT